MSQRVAHERIRRLLAARLDGPISRNEHRLLAGHLRTCLQCRLVDQDYRAQRAQLRSMPPPIPPRDLWPRTSAALDRELAHSRGRFGRRRPTAALGRQVSRSGHSALLVGLLATIGAVTALATFRIVPELGTGQPREAALPTPFSVADQQLSFVGGGAEKLAVYQTRVNRVCPTSAPDCVTDEGFTSTPIGLPNGARPRNVALSPSGKQLAVVGEDVGADVFAVVLMPTDDNSGVQPVPNSGQTSGGPGDRSGPPVSGQGGGAQTPGTGDTQSPAGDGSSSSPGDVPPAGSSSSDVPPTAAVAGLTVLAILDGVHSAGAPPAWSADGETLAFSAMPADGSHGPDIYIWQPSDTRARAVTSDHNSFFASWSGSDIVASRLLNDPSAGAPRVATVVIDPLTSQEQVVDGPQMWLPAVNAGRDTALVWYGQLAWNGPLPTPGSGSLYLADWTRLDPYAAGDGGPVATQSASPSAPPSEAPTGSPSASPPSPSASAAAPDSGAPSASALPADSLEPPNIDAAKNESPAESAGSGTPPVASTAATDAGPASSAPGSSASPSTVPDGSAPASLLPDGSIPISSAPSSTEPTVSSPPTTDLPAVLSPLDPNSSFTDGGVTDWQVRWSSDGQALGVWIADVPGSSWGQLVVLALDPQTAQLATEAPLVPPTLARRGFTLGISRVAFVGPSDEAPDGELRVRTWGPIGSGDLHLRAPDVEELVPAF